MEKITQKKRYMRFLVDSVAMPLRARYTFALAPVVREIEKRISNFDSKNEIEKRN